METFWSVQASKVMEIVPMEATEKGVERGGRRGREPKTDSPNAVCLPALLKIVFAFFPWRDTHSAEEKRSRVKLGMRRRRGRGRERVEFVCKERTIHFRVAVLDPSVGR